jgi:aspartyl-tRNA(Asn)/glutamyl-tRNA(Gln) amidotransferase subunit A
MTPADALARIRRYDGRLKAFVRVFDPPLRGPNAEGPTFAIKDLFDVAGVPTGGGARTPLDPSPGRHAVVVQRLLDAGWQAIGKTQTVELAYGGWGSNRAVGGPRNPWDAVTPRVPGGSSSGSAVAVAAGFCDAALGSDTGGSVRIPAATCGVVGLKPGRGLVSLAGVHPLSPSLDTVGVLARDVATAARALEIISGPDGEHATRPVFVAERRPRSQSWRLGAFAPESLGPLDPDIARLYAEAVTRLIDAGMQVETVQPPAEMDDTFTANGLLMAAEGWRIWGERIRDLADEMDPWIVRRFEAGRDVSDERLADVHRQRKASQIAVHAWMSGYDALLSPTCPIPASPLVDVDETVSPLSRLTRAANYLDLPAISVPCGLTPAGLPVGLQILGRPCDEVGIVSLAQAFEALSGWTYRGPDLSGFEG